ncbi:hypothetical protein CASFOL_011038 [Castilleja foliolosa]|uniref:non-specific serine/threonine protein kinase n=1 Tax=Castilleja foliolosa TaxID=1961234 RepID=A0ABD3DUS2_9LAMI
MNMPCHVSFALLFLCFLIITLTSKIDVSINTFASTLKKKSISSYPVPHKTSRVSRSQFSYAFVAIAIIFLVNIFVHKLREHSEANNSSEEENIKPSARAERHCRRFSLIEIQLATANFSDGHLIGRGGFGKVYKGLIDSGQTTVAVKRLKSNSMQGANEFLMEIETLSELRHVNLVSLIGYCNEHREMILVYDYMARGTLSDHLYNNVSSLTWKQRLNICIGVGRGLDYLHTGNGIIHRDVKTSNILLDNNFVAKVSDFGLAKHEDRKNKLSQSHISTRVKGTKGYLDPHYLHTRKLTRKTDTYAFGVVLFEILCGRPAVDLSVAEDKHILTIWARDKINKGEVDQIVVSSLRKDMSPASLRTFVGVAERCLDDNPKKRPTMSQVVQQLELALEQHDNKKVLVVTETASASPVEEQTNRQPVNDLNQYVRRERARMPLWLRPWDTIWNRVKPSKKNDSLSEIWDEVNIRLTEYDWDMIAAATNEFSTNHKIGRRSVYKGVLPNGQLVAIERLSPSSGQSLSKFKNEIHLVPNLQHRKVIKLLGYCIHGEEKLLIYEFMENISLDTLIDDKRQRRQLLRWGARLKIIKGIARGVDYLHKNSGLGVIHRNIEPGNILLDKEMNPKILDFAIARTLVEDYSELETPIVGISVYRSPECHMHGKWMYSVKSDVYSFGIMILEIVSGCRETGWCKTNNLGYRANEHWSEGRAYDLIDKSLEGAFPEDEALMCIHVGLLCIQSEPKRRPDMQYALKMLEGDEPLMNTRSIAGIWPRGNHNRGRFGIWSRGNHYRRRF